MYPKGTIILRDDHALVWLNGVYRAVQVYRASSLKGL